LQTFREREHVQCHVCGDSASAYAGLSFRVVGDHEIAAPFTPHKGQQSYSGIVHGGIIATVLDSALVQCLFAHGIAGVTGDLHIRYRRPVIVGVTFTVHGRLVGLSDPLYILDAELTDGQKVYARARGKFVRKQEIQVE
jgi:uncharacterized protein (TIGR00369 family)